MSTLRCTFWALMVENGEKYENWMCSELCKNTMDNLKACLRVAEYFNSILTPDSEEIICQELLKMKS